MRFADLFPRLSVARQRIVELEGELSRIRSEHAEEMERVRADCESEKTYARHLVESAMLKGGMWPAGAIAEATTATESDEIPTPFRASAAVPLHVAAAEDEAEEIREYEEYVKGLQAAAKGSRAS